MKNLLTPLFISFFVQISYAQDWALFPEGQKTYWEADGEFHLYYNDVNAPGSVTDRHYFGAEYLTEDSAFQCYKDILEYEYQLDEAPIDSLFSTPGYWFDFLGNDEIRFYHLTEPGESWTNITPSISGADSIIFTCTSKSEGFFFGATDSVKIFSLQAYNLGVPISKFNNVEYKLSKSHGFLQFIPLRSLGGQLINYEMMGFDNGDVHGFTSSWEDFFGKFKVGQTMKWKEFSVSISAPPGFIKVESYYIDSIVQITFIDTLVELGIERYGRHYYWKNSTPLTAPWDSTGTFNENDTVRHFNSNYKTVLASPPGWFKIDHDFQTSFYQFTNDFVNWENPTIKYNVNYYVFDTTDCSFISPHPYYLPAVITAGLGRTFSGYVDGPFGEHFEKKLIGYSRNGETFGDVINPVFSRPTPNLSFQLSPNPTANELNINFPEKTIAKKLELKITDITGSIVLSKNIKSGIGKMDVSAFPAGIYFVVVNGEGVFGRERFVKY